MVVHVHSDSGHLEWIDCIYTEHIQAFVCVCVCTEAVHTCVYVYNQMGCVSYCGWKGSG